MIDERSWLPRDNLRPLLSFASQFLTSANESRKQKASESNRNQLTDRSPNALNGSEYRKGSRSKATNRSVLAFITVLRSNALGESLAVLIGRETIPSARSMRRTRESMRSIERTRVHVDALRHGEDREWRPPFAIAEEGEEEESKRKTKTLAIDRMIRRRRSIWVLTRR